MSHLHQEILDVINQAFSFSEKPSPGPNRNHCDECTECYDYIIRLNPSDVSLDDVHDRWQFGFCGSEYRKYLFPGICRECLKNDALGIEILFFYMDAFDTLSESQRDGLGAFYQYLFDCGFALEEPSLHRELRERLEMIKSKANGSGNGNHSFSSPSS